MQKFQDAFGSGSQCFLSPNMSYLSKFGLGVEGVLQTPPHSCLCRGRFFLCCCDPSAKPYSSFQPRIIFCSLTSHNFSVRTGIGRVWPAGRPPMSRHDNTATPPPFPYSQRLIWAVTAELSHYDKPYSPQS